LYSQKIFCYIEKKTEIWVTYNKIPKIGRLLLIFTKSKIYLPILYRRLLLILKFLPITVTITTYNFRHSAYEYINELKSAENKSKKLK